MLRKVCNAEDVLALYRCYMYRVGQNNMHIHINIQEMGINLMSLPDGRVQLLHTYANALSQVWVVTSLHCHLCGTYWVPQKLPKICTVIVYICIGKVA